MNEDLNGLILIGGQSTRMGEDKSAIQYHEKPQVQHLFELLSSSIPETYISMRKDQKIDFSNRLITDNLEVKGPLNGLLSAYEAFPFKAWLVLAVDMPFITDLTIEELIRERDMEVMATSLIGLESGLPEPLAAIWELQALKALKRHHLNGDEIFPRKFLTENQIKSVRVKSDKELFNVNDKMDFEKAKSIIEQNK
ncbi:MAG: NTP transferase domain-containing protein [Ekhidna sp.]